MHLGIDVGGTSVKFGLVSENGEVSEYASFDTREKTAGPGLIPFIESEIKAYTSRFPEISRIGLGFPGLLSGDRKEILLLPNIPSVKDLPVIKKLQDRFPGMEIKMENDANCATLGEFYFGKHERLTDFLLVTLGTGIGSGAMIGKKLFTGARGNAIELGHILIRENHTLEQLAGLHGFISYAKEQIRSYRAPTLLREKGLTPKAVFEAAEQEDPLAVSLYGYLGKILGQGLVATVRVLDIPHILLGGGIAGAFDHILPGLEKTLREHLPPYYTDELSIQKASLKNHAGLLGTAGLFLSLQHDPSR